MEIRIIGTQEQLEQAERLIEKSYIVEYKSKLYSCKGSLEEKRQYYKVIEKENDNERQNHN